MNAPQTLARRLGGLAAGWVLAAGMVACGPPPGLRVLASGGSVVDLSLVPDDRYALLTAVDVVLFAAESGQTFPEENGNQVDLPAHPCQALMEQRLQDSVLRADSREHARLCDLGNTETLQHAMGRVSQGRKAVLVTVAHLGVACDASGQDEISRPGQVLAAGCEEVEAVAGKQVGVEVVLVPWRDPP